MRNKQIKFLYCLVSTLEDLYYEQAFISITSLRMHNPNAFVSLLTDKDTIISIEDKKANIRKIVDEIIIEDFSDSLNRFNRSRYLKTIMRNKISGDFLYIDSDTIISQNLDDIQNFEFDLGAVLDFHKLLSSHFLKSQIIERRKLLLDNPDFYNHPYYFNGGLLFVRDTDFNRLFFNKWHENYLIGNKNNLFMDQPSLALTDYQLGFPIKELNGKWNVQIWHGVNFFNDAKIVHYFSTILDYRKYEPFNSSLPIYLRNNGYLSKDDLSIIARPLTFFGNESYIITNENYRIFYTSISGFVRNLYRYKLLFRITEIFFNCIRSIFIKLGIKN